MSLTDRFIIIIIILSGGGGAKGRPAFTTASKVGSNAFWLKQSVKIVQNSSGLKHFFLHVQFETKITAILN